MTDLSPEARELLALTRKADGPRDHNRRRVATALSASLGTSLAATASAAAVGTATSSSVASGLAAKVLIAGLIGVGAGLTVTVPAVVLIDRAEQPALPAPRENPPPAVARDVPVTRGSPLPAPAPLQAQKRALGHTVEPSALRPVPIPPHVAARASGSNSPAPTAADLAREAELLAGAQAELGIGRAQRALALLNEHERRHPAGALAQERAAAQVIALCQAGQTEQARARAEEFLKRAPDSVLVPRIRSSCAFKAAAAASATAAYSGASDGGASVQREAR